MFDHTREVYGEIASALKSVGSSEIDNQQPHDRNRYHSQGKYQSITFLVIRITLRKYQCTKYHYRDGDICRVSEARPAHTENKPCNYNGKQR